MVYTVLLLTKNKWSSLDLVLGDILRMDRLHGKIVPINVFLKQLVFLSKGESQYSKY